MFVALRQAGKDEKRWVSHRMVLITRYVVSYRVIGGASTA
jgi:hypothetical protein